MLATLRIGGIVSGASPAYNVEEMTYALKTSGAKFLMTHPDSMGVAVEAAANAGIARDRLFLLEGEMEGFRNVKELIEMGKAEKEQVESVALPVGKKNGDVCAFLSFSSGTTGLPKAVCVLPLSHCLLSCCMNFEYSRCLGWIMLTRCCSQVMISHQNVIAQCLQVQQITPADHKKVLAVLP